MVSVRPTPNFLMVCLSTGSSKECCSIASIESSSMHLKFFLKMNWNIVKPGENTVSDVH